MTDWERGKTRLGLVVGRDETWAFVRDLYEDWQKHYQVDVFSERTTHSPFFKERLNRRTLRRDLAKFLTAHDLVFFEWATEYLIVASWLPKKCRIVTRLHSYEIFEFAPRVNWNNIDRIILVSGAMQRRFNALYPDTINRTEVVYNGVDLDRFRPREDPARRTIGMLCNLIAIKRVYEVILDIYQLRLSGHAFCLRIGGAPQPGPDNQRYFASLQRLIETLDLTDCVTLEGYIDRPAEFMCQIEVFVSNSFWEGQQVALIEAMASGCFCLSHFWDGVEEVLPVESIYITGHEFRQKLVAYTDLSAEEQAIRRGRLRTIAEQKFDTHQTEENVRAILKALTHR